jgi:DNA-binding NtrC family response regulator
VLHKDGLQMLEAYSWPGNVRELRNTLERALMLSETEHIDARALSAFIDAGRVAIAAQAEPATHDDGDPPNVSYADAMADFERRFLSDALRASGGRVSDAAEQIGIGRATLYKKIAALGIAV